MRVIFRGRGSICWSWSVAIRGRRRLSQILRDSRSARCCIFSYKMRRQDGTGKLSEAAGARWRFHGRIMVGACSNHAPIVFVSAEAIHGFLGQILNSEFRGNIWWCRRVTPVAPRIVLDSACVRKINHQCHFSWQVQYLVMLEGDSCCSVHCTGRFMCDGDQSWAPFFMAGAVFGDVGVWVLLLRAMHWMFHGLRPSNMNVVVPLRLESYRLLRAMYWTLHVATIKDECRSSIVFLIPIGCSAQCTGRFMCCGYQTD